MQKGPFSVEWLAQSSRGGAPRPRSPPRGTAGRESPGMGRESSRALREPRREGAGSPLQTAPSVTADRSSPGQGAGPGGGVVPGRPRTKFSPAQLQELERSFREQRYIGAGEKRRLAAALNLSQSQIKTWFQNRRMKFKRQTQDARIEALFSGLFLPYPCYPDVATSSYSHGTDVSVSTSAVSLHSAVPNSALLPPVPAQSLQRGLPSPALLMPSGTGLPYYSSLIPAVTVTTEHKRLSFQPYLPSC